MNRRTLLKTLGISAVGVATLPLWMSGWTPEKLPPDSLNLTVHQKLLISDLVEAIIPASDLPGAKELGVDRFVVTLVKDCFEKDVQNDFVTGLNELEEVAKSSKRKSFTDLKNNERIEILNGISASEMQSDHTINFLFFVKRLTIDGYMSSQFVLENILGYEFIPSRFHGSLPIEESIYSKT